MLRDGLFSIQSPAASAVFVLEMGPRSVNQTRVLQVSRAAGEMGEREASAAAAVETVPSVESLPGSLGTIAASGGSDLLIVGAPADALHGGVAVVLHMDAHPWASAAPSPTGTSSPSPSSAASISGTPSITPTPTPSNFPSPPPEAPAVMRESLPPVPSESPPAGMQWVLVELNGTVALSVFGSAPAVLQTPQNEPEFQRVRERIQMLVGTSLLRSLGGDLQWGLQDGTVGSGGVDRGESLWARARTYGHAIGSDGSELVLHSTNGAVDGEEDVAAIPADDDEASAPSGIQSPGGAGGGDGLVLQTDSAMQDAQNDSQSSRVLSDRSNDTESDAS